MLGQLTSDFLRHQREREIDAQYERAYADGADPLGKDFEGWEDEGIWPSGDLEIINSHAVELDEEAADVLEYQVIP